MPQYTEKELEKLINDVEAEFTSHLAKAEENFKLSKAEDGEKKPPFEKKPEEKKPEGEHKPEEKAPAEGGEKAPAEGEHKPAEGEKAPEGEHKPEGEQQAAPEGAGAGHDYDEKDIEHMNKMYMSMSEGELKAHHDSIKNIANSRQGSLAKCGDMSPGGALGAPGKESPDSAAHGEMNKNEPKRENGGQISAAAPPAASPGAKSPASKVEGVQMGKSENQDLELLKSEIATEKAKTEGLQKSLDAVSAFLTKLVEKKVAPQGKAITSLDVIAKSEGGKEEKSLTKSEIDSALSRKSQDPKLEKSDRDLINAFYLSNGSINSISHLLK